MGTSETLLPVNCFLTVLEGTTCLPRILQCMTLPICQYCLLCLLCADTNISLTHKIIRRRGVLGYSSTSHVNGGKCPEEKDEVRILLLWMVRSIANSSTVRRLDAASTPAVKTEDVFDDDNKEGTFGSQLNDPVSMRGPTGKEGTR